MRRMQHYSFRLRATFPFCLNCTVLHWDVSNMAQNRDITIIFLITDHMEFEMQIDVDKTELELYTISFVCFWPKLFSIAWDCNYFDVYGWFFQLFGCMNHDSIDELKDWKEKQQQNQPSHCILHTLHCICELDSGHSLQTKTEIDFLAFERENQAKYVVRDINHLHKKS